MLWCAGGGAYSGQQAASSEEGLSASALNPKPNPYIPCRWWRWCAGTGCGWQTRATAAAWCRGAGARSRSRTTTSRPTQPSSRASPRCALAAGTRWCAACCLGGHVRQGHTSLTHDHKPTNAAKLARISRGALPVIFQLQRFPLQSSIFVFFTLYNIVRYYGKPCMRFIFLYFWVSWDFMGTVYPA